jgi:Tfp pilus assembly protein PilO
MLVPAIEQINPWSKMFRFIVAVLVLAAVSAFAPAGRFGARTTSIAMTNVSYLQKNTLQKQAADAGIFLARNAVFLCDGSRLAA